MTSDEAMAYVDKAHIFWTADTVGAVIGNLHDAGRALAAEVRRLRDRYAAAWVDSALRRSDVSERNEELAYLSADLAAARAEAAQAREWAEDREALYDAAMADIKSGALLTAMRERAERAEAEAARLHDLIDSAKNVMLSFYQRAPIEVREWLASVEEPHDPR